MNKSKNNNKQQLVSRMEDFLSSDSSRFHAQKFESSNILIDILREKASKQSLLQKCLELISKQNECEQLLEDIVDYYGENIESILKSPSLYGKQLQNIRNDINIAKKKISQTKQSLLKNEKDLIQLNYNSIYNKIIFNKLKNIQNQVNKYNKAILCFKHNNFQECSKLLPVVQGQASFLQHNIKFKMQNLKNNLFIKCCTQSYKFLFFTGDVVYPTQNTVLERIKQDRGEWDMDNSIPDMIQHLEFYEKYQLLKKIHLNSYMATLWNLNDFQNKTGTINGIIKAVHNIGKSQQLFDHLASSYKNGIKNIYTLLLLFFIFQKKKEQSQGINKVYTNSSNSFNKQIILTTMFDYFDFNSKKIIEELKLFTSTVLAVSGILLRKFIVLYKLYNEIKIELKNSIEFKDIVNLIFEHIKEVIFKFILFPHLEKRLTQEYNQLETGGKWNEKDERVWIKKWMIGLLGEKYKYPRLCLCLLGDMIQQNLKHMIQNLIIIIEVQLPKMNSQKLKQYKIEFYNHLFLQFQKHLENQLLIYYIQFICQNFNKLKNKLFQAISYNEFQSLINLNQVHQFYKIGRVLKLLQQKYINSQKKQTIKQFYNIAFLIQQIFSYQKLSKWKTDFSFRITILILIFFYCRLVQYCQRQYLPTTQISQKILQKRADKRVRDQQSKFTQKYNYIFRKLDEGGFKRSVKRLTYVQVKKQNVPSSIMPEVKTKQKLKVLLCSMEYLFDYLNQQLKPLIQNVGINEGTEQYVKTIESYESINYDDDMKLQLNQLFKSLPQDYNQLKQMGLGLFKKYLQTYCILRVRCKIDL